MDNKEVEKIKTQKNAAILLIVGSMIILISYLGKTDFDTNRNNNYVICGALLVLIICGSLGLRNSLHKQKEQDIKAR